MPKPFQDSFREWVADDKYVIQEDCGWEFADNLEAGPTPADRSLTLDSNGQQDPK